VCGVLVRNFYTASMGIRAQKTQDRGRAYITYFSRWAGHAAKDPRALHTDGLVWCVHI
jgi:hypothetical protein